MRGLGCLALAWLGAASGLALQGRRTAPRRTGLSMALQADVVVVGSGISGSCAAHYAHKGGANVLLCEKNAVVGGNVISKTNAEGYTWEEGPNSFQPNKACMRTCHELGLGPELVYADATLPPWVWWEGKLHALPKNLPGDLFTFNLLSWPGRIRAGLGAIGFPGVVKSIDPEYDENIAEFVTRHLGPEAFQRIIEPFVSGVYAGDPAKLSMKSALKKIYRLQQISFNGALVPGGVLRFQEMQREKIESPPEPEWPTFKSGELCSFKKGLQTLPNAVAAELGPERVRTGWALDSLAKASAGSGKKWAATFKTGDGTLEVVECNAVVKGRVGKHSGERHRDVICTAPAHVISQKVVRELDSDTADVLKKVYYPPVGAVTIAYPKTAFRDECKDLRGFGNLNPRSQRVRTLGTIWSSSLFPGRCPDTHHLLLNYIGGSKDVGIADLSNDELVAEVDAGCRVTLLKADAPPPVVLGIKLWPQAIPQYERGHSSVIEALDTFEKKFPGIYLGGNYRTGVAFGDCVAFGLDQATAVLSSLKVSVPVKEELETVSVSA